MTRVVLRIPRPKIRNIKVISTSFGFAAVEHQTIKRKTLKILVKFGVAAPGPWGEGRDHTPEGADGTYPVNTCASTNWLLSLVFAVRCAPIFP